MKDSERETLRKRAQFIAGNMGKYRWLLLATLRLAPNEKIAEKARDVLARLERNFGPTGPLDRAAGLALFMTGLARRSRTRYFGDTIQPRTRVTNYNH